MSIFCSVQGEGGLSTGFNRVVNEERKTAFNTVMGKKGHCPAYDSEEF